MKKTVRLTEEHLSRLVNKVLNEQPNVVNIKNSSNLREIPDNTVYRQVSIKRKGDSFTVFVPDLKTRFQIRVP
jgi:nitrogen fixation protein